MRKSLDDLLMQARGILGENASDEALSFLEDMSDSYNPDLDENGKPWRERYEENDAQWRERYKERFFAGPDDKGEPDKDEDDPEPEKALTYEDLFEEKED